MMIRRGGGRGQKISRERRGKGKEEVAVRGRAGGITVRRGEAEEGKGLQVRRRGLKGKEGAARDEVQKKGGEEEEKVRRGEVEGRRAVR